MVRTKTVARKARGGTVSVGCPTPTQPVLTQDVEAEVARATEAAQHVARLRAMLDVWHTLQQGAVRRIDSSPYSLTRRR